MAEGFERSRAHATRRRGSALIAALVAAMTALVVGATPAVAQPTVTPTSISVTSGAVCTGGSQEFPVSIQLPPDAVVDKVDVGLLLDDTGSFSSFGPTVASIFSDLVTELQTTLPTVDFGFGVSRFEDYGGPGNTYSGDTEDARPFILNQPIVTEATAGSSGALNTLITDALGTSGPGFGGDGPETGIEGLNQIATGAGFDGNGNGSTLESGDAGAASTQTAPGTSGDVPPFSSNVAPASGTLGGLGFRSDALHLVITATDIATVAPFPTTSIPSTITGTGGSEPSANFDSGFGRFGPVGDSKDASTNTVTGAIAPSGSATLQSTVSALNALGIRVLGMGPGVAPTDATGPSGDPSIWLSSMARLTGAVDDTGTPLVFDTSVAPADLASAIAAAISTSATTSVDIGLTTTPTPAGLTFSYTPAAVTDVGPGDTAAFTVTLEGDGSPISGSFDIVFSDVSSGATFGTIPVSVSCGGPSVEPTTLTTELVSGETSGTDLSVPPGTAVHDTATLSGANASGATGTVTYTVYSNAACTTVAADAGTKTVSGGVVPDSDPVSLSTPGTYYWRAAYSGDASNGASSSACGDEVLTVAGGTMLSVTSSVKPRTITTGGTAKAHFSVRNAGPDRIGVALVIVTLPPGATPVSVTPSKGLCGDFVGDTALCLVGGISAGGSRGIDVVFSADPGATGTQLVTVDVLTDGGESASESVGPNAVVPRPGYQRGYVMPGGQISTGTKATPDNPVVATFILPNSGQGAPITLRAENPTPDTACPAGDTCFDKVLYLSPFSGYHDPRYPPRLKIRWDASVLGDNDISDFMVHVQKEPGGPLVAIPDCVDVDIHLADPSPCVHKRTERSDGDLEAEILLLSGDPKFR